jgi:hypothetical protein
LPALPLQTGITQPTLPEDTVAQLSLDKPIWGINGIKNLHSGHPVFLIVGFDGSHLVVKKETTLDKENLRRNQLSMQLASPQARSVILSNDEVWELNKAVSYAKSTAIIFSTPTSPDTLALAQYLGSPGTWFKMKEAKNILNLDAAVKQLQDGDKTGVRALAKALNGSGGLEALGKIVGADMFNNNTDRFTWKGGGRVFVGTEPIDVKSLINVGNVMAAMLHGKLTLIGLDSWDPMGQGEADMNRPVDTGEWLGMILAPSNWEGRLDFAQRITDDLNLLLGERHRRFKFLQQTRLNPDAPQRIVKGIESITKKLIERLVASEKRPGAPPGISSRLSVLRNG